MKYVLLLHLPETYMDEDWSAEDIAAHQTEYLRYKERLVADGVFLAGEALQPADIGTTVGVRGGEVVISDGPFAEIAEQIGGFYLCECRDLDHALAVAAGIPGARYGTVEVRPVFDYEALVN
ncbi:MAG: YciI family protein [Acidimicrobiia bacterium]|nr:YciI family protein [Acidimicrobiia bacterium]